MQQYEKHKSVRYQDTFGFYTNYKKSNHLLKQAIFYAVLSAAYLGVPSLLVPEKSCWTGLFPQQQTTTEYINKTVKN